jgi:hypothetical protein
MKKLAFLALLLAPAAWAGHSEYHIFLCNVQGFDKTMIKGQCDPSKPKRTMKIPREWIDEDQVVKVNATVKFMLKDSEFDQWMAMNQPKKGR